MQKLIVRSVLLMLMVLIPSCGEDADEAQDEFANIGNGKAGYSGITEVDENMTFKSVDLDDWRDDGILVDCVVYPNPVKRRDIDNSEYLIVRYKLLSEAYVRMLIRDSEGQLVPRGFQPSGRVIFTFGGISNSHHKPDEYIQNLDMRIRHTYLDIKDGVAIVRDEYEQPKLGIYRLFIYASESELMIKMLEDTGITNAPRDKYSMVYGDILVKD